MKKDRIFIALTIAVMAFIFVHSAMPGDVSGSESRYFAEILSAITGLSFPVAHFIVRKAAHFTVFAVLGICLSVNFNDYKTQNELVKTNELVKIDKAPANNGFWGIRCSLHGSRELFTLALMSFTSSLSRAGAVSSEMYASTPQGSYLGS